MAQLNIKHDERQLEALRRHTAARRTPVAWLIKDYIAHLVSGGEPISHTGDDVSAAEFSALAQHGGSFDWLAEEPDLYTIDDGEPL
jgi:hypothetical protein